MNQKDLKKIVKTAARELEGRGFPVKFASYRLGFVDMTHFKSHKMSVYLDNVPISKSEEIKKIIVDVVPTENYERSAETDDGNKYTMWRHYFGTFEYGLFLYHGDVTNSFIAGKHEDKDIAVKANILTRLYLALGLRG